MFLEFVLQIPLRIFVLSSCLFSIDNYVVISIFISYMYSNDERFTMVYWVKSADKPAHSELYINLSCENILALYLY